MTITDNNALLFRMYRNNHRGLVFWDTWYLTFFCFFLYSTEAEQNEVFIKNISHFQLCSSGHFSVVNITFLYNIFSQVYRLAEWHATYMRPFLYETQCYFPQQYKTRLHSVVRIWHSILHSLCLSSGSDLSRLRATGNCSDIYLLDGE